MQVGLFCGSTGHLARLPVTAESGKVVIQLCYGSKVIDIAKGKNSVEVSNGAELIAALETLKSAVQGGELDVQITMASKAVKARFGK